VGRNADGVDELAGKPVKAARVRATAFIERPQLSKPSRMRANSRLARRDRVQ
jgi:hypothetical protein